MEQRLGIAPLEEGEDTRAPYRLIEGDWSRGALILCDHAENSIPEELGTLGLRPEDLNRHIAYDLGAGAVAERLAALLGVPALIAQFSRLLIDPNRGLDDPTLIMQVSDGILVPANAGLSEAEIEARIAGYYRRTTGQSTWPLRRPSRQGKCLRFSRFTASLRPGRRSQGPGMRPCSGTGTRVLLCLS